METYLDMFNMYFLDNNIVSHKLILYKIYISIFK